MLAPIKGADLNFTQIRENTSTDIGINLAKDVIRFIAAQLLDAARCHGAQAPRQEVLHAGRDALLTLPSGAPS
jgi:hypothetical protein